jgi:sec-independent protein translocase protein TatA
LNLGPGELLLLFVVVLLLFAPAKLPALARSLGQAQREFRKGLKHGATGPASPSPSDTSSPEPTAGDGATHSTPRAD